MHFVKLLLALALVGGAYHFWNARDRASGAETGELGANGFVSLPAPANLNADTVVVLAAENCPKKDALRADSMAKELRRRDIPYTRAHSAQLIFAKHEPAVLKRLNAVMKGPLPVVFVDGRAKANPTLDEVISEYRTAYR